MIGRGETIRFAVLCELCFCLSTVNALEKMRGHETQTSSCYIFLRNQAPFRDKPLIVANTDSLFYPDCCLWPVDRLVQVISFPTFDKPALAAICLFATRGHWLPFKRTKKGPAYFWVCLCAVDEVLFEAATMNMLPQIIGRI